MKCLFFKHLLLVAFCPVLLTAAKITQFGTLAGLLEGNYYAETSLETMLQHGDFGLGTFEALDGEMLVHEGIIYQVKGDGSVAIPPADVKTPFAVVVPFVPENSRNIKQPLDFAAFSEWFSEQITDEQIFYAIRIRGSFHRIHSRSVPGQSEPYPPLLEVIADQPEFHFEQSEGIMVGFRSPSFSQGTTAAGDHLHFLTADKSGGGHVLDFVIKEATVEWAAYRDWRVVMPTGTPLQTGSNPAATMPCCAE